MRIKRVFLIASLLIMLAFTCGCDTDWGRLLQSDSEDEAQLFKAMIYFTDGATLEAYIKELGIEKDGTIYVGGSSLNYLYDRNGKVIGSYNYQRVLYIKIISEEETAD